MPRITRYEAADDKLNPDSKGYEGFETAGRRIGPLYNQAAKDIESQGVLQGDVIKASGWPLEFSRFRPSEVNIKFNTEKQSGPGRLRSAHDMSNGGPILSHAARSIVGGMKPTKSETIDLGTGGVINYKKNPLAKEQQDIENKVNGVPVDANGNPMPQVNEPSDSTKPGFGGGDVNTEPAYEGNPTQPSSYPSDASGGSQFSILSPSTWFDWAGSQVGTNAPDPTVVPQSDIDQVTGAPQ